MRDAYRRMRLAPALLVGFLTACDAAEPTSTPFQPSRRDDWPSVADWERPGPFLPAPLADAEPPWGKCLPEVPRGPLCYGNPALQIAAYESPRGRYFIERYGSVPVVTEESLKALNTRLANAYTNYRLPGTCPFYGRLVPAYCGCVDGECWWFEQ